MPDSIDELYGDFWGRGRPGFEERIERSLGPRGRELFFALFEELGVGAADVVLDIGCRDAVHAVEIASKLGCRVLAVDPIPVHLEWAKRRVEEASLGDRVELTLGRIEA